MNYFKFSKRLLFNKKLNTSTETTLTKEEVGKIQSKATGSIIPSNSFESKAQSFVDNLNNLEEKLRDNQVLSKKSKVEETFEEEEEEMSYQNSLEITKSDDIDELPLEIESGYDFTPKDILDTNFKKINKK